MGRNRIERLPFLSLVYGSVCSGIEACSVAWKGMGFKTSFLSEIARFPRAVLSYHYPETTLYGDFTKIQHDAAIDILVGGTPCQSFSIAGLRGGLDDDRGNLALEYLRLADRIRPQWIIWENVPGVLSSNRGRDFGAFLGGMGHIGYGWAYRVLDAQYFGVPQRRRRVFVVGHSSGDWRRAASVLFESQGLRRDSSPRKKTGTGTSQRSKGRTRVGRPSTAGTLGAGYGKKWGGNQDIREGMSLYPIERVWDMMPMNSGKTFKARPVDTVQCLTTKGNQPCNQGGTVVNVSMRLNAGGTIGNAGLSRGVSGTIDTTGRHGGLLSGQVRRLTPLECERLQGFPDGYTQIPYRGKEPYLCPDGPRYTALGNSMAVPVMEWIGRRILMATAK